MSINRGPELPGAVRLMKIPAATGNAAMQPVGARHHRQSLAFATATIQLQAACAARLPYSRQKSIAVAGPAGRGNATMMSMHAGIHRLQKR
jgi:predicted ABC-type transport system involved in lysophospholipase L1 biosynthesis ATPase subunit